MVPVGLLVAALLTGCPFVPYGQAILVDKDNPSNIRDGKTWATAYHAIQAGIDAAQQNGISEVWVAEGTYDEMRASAANGSLVMAEGINVYGGFAGTEESRSERNPLLHPTIIDGSKAFSGSAAFHVILGATATLDGFTVTGGNADASLGEATGFGAGMYNYGTKPAVANCVFTGNAASTGGAMYNYGAHVTLTNSIMHDNTALDGGAIYNQSTTLTATNVLFYANKAPSGMGSALFDSYSASVLMNCTIQGNVARSGTVYSFNAAPAITNSIIWGNTGGTFEGDPSTVTYSDVEGGFADSKGTNIDADPLFANVDAADFRIASDSPCVDAGTTVNAPTTDIDGQARPQPAYGAIDLGVYEVTATGTPTAVFACTPSVGAIPLDVQFTDRSWPGGSVITAWAWDFGDGTTSTLRNPVHTYTQAGVYAVTLSVTTSLGSNTRVTSNCVTANMAVFVDAGNASSVADGTSWATAFTTIQPAIDKAVLAGAGEVWVAEGTYTGTGNTVVTLHANVEVYGGFAGNETTRDDRRWAEHVTSIDGEGSRRCVIGADDAVLDGFFIMNGHAAEYGGGLYNSAQSPQVAHCTFTVNTAQWGGAIFNAAASPTITDCTFLANVSTEGGYGGAVFCSGGAPSITACTFTGNVSTSGGALFCSNSDGTLSGSTFTSNQAAEGGAIYNRGGTALAITNCTFTNNTASASGGAISNQEASPTIDSCTFTENEATNNGAAIDNTDASPAVTDCLFTANDASSNGGAFSASGGLPALVRCTFSSNSSGRDGGALFFDESDFSVDSCDFSGNDGSSGGAVFLRSGGGAIADSTFNANSGSQGAGLFASLGSTVSVARCDFTANDASGNGGGASANNASPAFVNCVFWNNSAAWGAGLYNWGSASTATVDSCTFGGNTASYKGGGMRNNLASPTVSNSILWDDAPDEIAGADDGAQFSYCDIEGGYDGTGNIAASPLYADLSGGDLRIGYGSPCMDTGIDQNAPETDRLGVVRPQGAFADRGAFEIRRTGTPAAMFDATPAKGVVPVTVQFTDRSWPGGADLTQWNWDFGDGTTSTIASPSHTYTAVGTYTVTLAVQSSLGSNTMIRSGCVVVQTPVRVSAANTSGTYDGLTWETAFQTLQQGVDDAAAGGSGEVWVAAGTYTDVSDAVVTLAEGVKVYGGFAGTETLRDQRDPLANPTVIDGENTRRCAVGADAALLEGFTLTRGHSYDYGGALISQSVSPTIRNCIFTLNSAEWGAAAFNSEGEAVFESCAFTENTTTESGYGGAVFNTGGSPHFTDCSFESNVSYVGGAVFNQTTQAIFASATFYYNDAAQGGGVYNTGSAGPELTECRFVGNTCDGIGGGIFNGTDATTAIDHSFFADNTATYGGAIGNEEASPLISNCVMTANTSSNGSGVYNRTSSAVIANCTIVDNIGNGFTAQAVGNASSATARIINCILWNPNMFELPLVPDTSYVVTYSLIRNGFSGTGNLDTEPTFVGTGDNPYALQSGSAGIDEGTDTSAAVFGSVTTDILGTARGIDGDALGAITGDGSDYDVGAYEYVPATGKVRHE